MKLALIGYGVMGRLVEDCARQAGHEVTLRLDLAEAELSFEALADRLKGADATLDFSVGSAVPRNVEACMRAGIPLVEGATGWNEQLPAVRRLVQDHHGAMIYGANFSVGVNLFYRIADRAAELLSSQSGYAPFIEEAHHSRKLDAPSGTARKLGDILAARLGHEVPVSTTRAGFIPGTHRVGFDSPGDQIMLVHTARSREGFAAGALAAAAWIRRRKGIYEFSAVLDDILAK